MEANALRTGRAIPTGMALAVTAVTFMNWLFHGLDFRKLQAGLAPERGR